MPNSFLKNFKNRFQNWLSGEFVIVFHESRAGSTVLGDLLDQHPSVLWIGEVYEKLLAVWNNKYLLSLGEEKVEKYYKSKHYPTLLEEYQKMREGKGQDFLIGENVISVLEKIKEQSTPTNFFGIEVQSHHLELGGIELKEYIEKLKGIGVRRFIILERKNYLRVAVSHSVSQHNARFHITKDVPSNLTSIEINANDFHIERTRQKLLDYLRNTQQKYKNLKNILAPEKPLYLSYEEDIFANPLSAYKKICEFLNIPALEETSIRYNKTNPFPLKDIIKNFKEIESLLNETEFAWMLENGTS